MSLESDKPVRIEQVPFPQVVDGLRSFPPFAASDLTALRGVETVQLVHAREGAMPFLRQFQIDHPPVIRATRTPNESFAFQAVEHPGHGPGDVGDSLAEVGGGFHTIGRREGCDESP